MTAMQTLISQLQNEISELEKKIEKCSDNKNVYIGHKYGLNHALEIAESFLEMEKEQIKDAYYKGGDDLTKMHFIESEQYYNETFKSE